MVLVPDLRVQAGLEETPDRVDLAWPGIVTDALLWRVAPDAEELVIGLEELFRHLPA